MIGRAEVNCWGAGDEEAGHDRAGVGMTGQGDVGTEDSGQKVRERGAGPWVGISPSARGDV